jgi:hypothetical protein
MIKLKYLYSVIFCLIILSCKDDPKIITATSTDSSPDFESGIFTDTENETEHNHPISNGSFTDNLHTVVVTKVLPTKKYVYLNVTENGKQYWLATAKQDINVGNTYFYRDGLLKTNFESKEYNRVFDTIYLVSKIVSQNHSNNPGNLTANFTNTEKVGQSSQKEVIPTHTDKIVQHSGSIKISELVKNPKTYEGKTVQISGKVIKVNPNIMNRNWLHLQDGSKNDYDLVVTTNTFVPEGKNITIKAKVSLDRDFGAGYRYDLILEDGQLIE